MGKVIDLTGQKFGKLFVTARARNSINTKDKYAYWICKCDCGNKKVVRGQHLKTGNTKSCGCLGRGNPCINLVGQRFGKLLVIKKSEIPPDAKNKSIRWLCKCDCGNKKVISGQNLRNGDIKSCGCFGKSRRINRVAKTT